jgi:hypothetical protein
VFSTFIHNSQVIIFAQVKIAISFKKSFLSSQKPGFLIAKIFREPFILFKTIAVRASQSISSAKIVSSFCQFSTNFSNIGNRDFVSEIFWSVIKIGLFDITASIFSDSEIIYGLIYHWSKSIP